MVCSEHVANDGWRDSHKSHARDVEAVQKSCDNLVMRAHTRKWRLTVDHVVADVFGGDAGSLHSGGLSSITVVAART